tara:strand:- start:3852 stop:4337 length:486 start_codon:yes stop_codon:yes gene_type:complete
MIKIRFNNKFQMIISIIIMLMLFFIAFLLPFWITSYLKFSGIKHFLDDNYLFPISCGVLFVYFLIVGQYYYNVYIDKYVLQIYSYRSIPNLFFQKNYIDISHSMLVDFRFFKRSFTFNRILMIKLRSENKIIIKRFNLTFITKEEVVNLSRSLEKIIENNK